MNRIDELIKKLCPNGVEYRPIWSLTAWDKKFNGVDKEKQKKVISYKYYLSTDFTKVEKENGNIKYISTGISGDDRYTTEELAGDYIADGEVVCIPWGGTPNIKYHKGKFVTGDNRIATSLDVNILSNKFLYYWMQSKINVISKFYRGSGIKHPSMQDVLDMNIAVPPLEVQCEIVHILDDFTLLSAELSAELEARQKQFKHYLNKVFVQENCEYKKLEEICEIRGRIGFRGYTKEDMVREGEGAISLTASNITRGYHTDYTNNTYLNWEKYEESPEIKVSNGDIILCQRGSIGKSAIVENLPEKATINPQLLLLKNIKCNNYYLALYFRTNDFLRNLEKITGHGTVQMIAQKDVKKLEIPVPTKERQKEIVNILNKLDKMCNDIFEGLPAEIEARQKQYEYYRDKLLTFKELKVNE